MARPFLVEDDAGWQELARYVHLNPVRVSRLGLGKGARAGAKAGMPPGAEPELVAERLRTLARVPLEFVPRLRRLHAAVAWVWSKPLAGLCGGKSREEQRAALEAYTEGALLQGGVEPIEPIWDKRVVDGFALGSAAFAQTLRDAARGNAREQQSLRSAAEVPSWPQIVGALEKAKGEAWDDFAHRHGDWGRDAALWLGRRAGRLPLRELGELAGGSDYAVVSKSDRAIWSAARVGRLYTETVSGAPKPIV